MKNLTILKGLADYIWILTCIPILIFLPIGYIYGFFDSDAYNILFEAGESNVNYSNPFVHFILLLFMVLTFVSIYCFYLFRKTLDFFLKAEPFHEEVIVNFYKIGRFLVIIGILGSVFLFLVRMIVKNQLKLNLGLSPYIIILCLGLFFMVLSEVFKVAKKAKEENELTV
ncbi:DUF2975 domain-containing protein [Winogradskyella costae]|uniref:DUF2975 domain-containing protein n=1 Tax=Winogradskyella costae TaxID=2697008 RepID=UPI0015CD5376|nr:DUF2975 domain-containing protein [Winogradskyella costae]